MDQNRIKRQKLAGKQRLVVKLGSRVLVDEKGHPDHESMERIVAGLAEQHQAGKEIILVSSGAIAMGLEALGKDRRPDHLPELQMAAAVGQSRLMHTYATYFEQHNVQIGQVLLTHEDLNDRERHLNARNTMRVMLNYRLIPVVNENDVVAVEEIQFGDNDNLASMVAALVEADLLILLTSTNGLRDKLGTPDEERIPYLENIDRDVLSIAGRKGSEWSSGGMYTKLQSAERAVRAGTQVVIADGRETEIIRRILEGEDLGTFIDSESADGGMRGRKRWIAFFRRARGSLTVDSGAARAITENGNSLLPVGIKEVDGRFSVGDLVNVKSEDGEVVARGLTAYGSEDVDRIKGLQSTEISSILGETHFEEVIHRDNMVIVKDRE
ncbi:MAG: glutamate 5-kinase [Balneolaceae bacterium]